MTLRIVDMYQRGELDASVAMQLLGSGVGSMNQDLGGNTRSGKRPHDQQGDASEHCEGEGPGDDESLDDLLNQAKRAKMETLLHFLVAINPSVKIYWHILFQWSGLAFPIPYKTLLVPVAMSDKEDNALKAKLRRLCEVKSDGKMRVPQWLHDQWRNGDHLAMARQFESCNFDKAHLETNNIHCCQAASLKR